MNLANMKLVIFCESKSQVIDIMPLGRFMSTSDLCWQIALHLQQMLKLYYHSDNTTVLL